MDLTIHAVFFSKISKEERRKVVMPYYEAYKAQYEKGMYALEHYYPSMDHFMKAMMDYGMKYMKDSLDLYEKLLELD